MKILSYFEQFFYKLKTALKNRLLIDFLKSRFPASEKLKDLATLNPYVFWWQMKLFNPYLLMVPVHSFLSRRPMINMAQESLQLLPLRGGAVELRLAFTLWLDLTIIWLPHQATRPCSFLSYPLRTQSPCKKAQSSLLENEGPLEREGPLSQLSPEPGPPVGQCSHMSESRKEQQKCCPVNSQIHEE